MKPIRYLIILALIVGLVASGGAWARGGGGHGGGGHGGGHSGGHSSGTHSGGRSHGSFHGGGVFFGGLIAAPLIYPYYYNPYPYYAPQAPPVYVEQGDLANGQGGYWYRCDNPPGYFPYVKECLGGWRQIVPTAPPY